MGKPHWGKTNLELGFGLHELREPNRHGQQIPSTSIGIEEWRL